MKSILLISPYWKEDHRWMVSSFKLAELWQRIGYKVVVVCMGFQTRTEKISETLTVHSCKDYFLPDPWNYGIAFGFTGKVFRIIAEEKPAIIVANKLLFWSSFSVIWLKLTGHRVIVITDAFVGMTWWPRGLLPRICAAIYAWTGGWLILLSASRVVLFHPQPPALLRQLCIGQKTQVIPTGIDSSQYQSPITNHQSPITNHQSPITNHQSPITITYVGRLESIKGVDDFLAALVPLKKDYPDMMLQVVGWYKDSHPLVQQYERDAVFTGLRHDIPAILSSTDIFVMPSHSEGLSNAIMEAMASSCAIVATEVGGNGFLIQRGVSGLLYPAGDRAALAAHVRRLMDDPAKRKSLGQAAKKRIDEVFDWKVVGEQYRELFEEIEGTKETKETGETGEIKA